MTVKKDYTIPWTQARLKPFMSLRMATYDGTKDFSDTDILTIPMIEVGGITAFKYTNDKKGGGMYREFNRQVSAKIREAYPGLPEYSLEFTNTVFYKKNLLEVLGYGLGDIGYMDKPLIIQVQLPAPSDSPERTWTFRSCWINDNPFEWEAKPSDMLISQKMSVLTAGIIEGEST